MGRNAPRKTILCWSSGKDSAWTLHLLRQMEGIEVVGLMTTINETYDRVSMHGVRRELVEMQAAAVGLPVEFVRIPHQPAEEEYDTAMSRFIDWAHDQGVSAIAFGDLFLADLRAYREMRMAGTGLEPIFPLWGIPTDELARTMCDAGLKAHLVCVDRSKLDPSFIGREFDRDLLASLPEQVDPCGERGEFHTFAVDGPMFNYPIEIGFDRNLVYLDFVYADLMAADSTALVDG